MPAPANNGNKPVPNKPVLTVNPEAVEWNLHIAERVQALLLVIKSDMADLVALSKEFVSGGTSAEWEVAWSNIRFAERTLNAWDINEQVSRRESEARFAPALPPPAPVIL
jgi:hypothetical protein